MPKKLERKVGFKDNFFWFGCILGSLACIGCMAPPLQWRYTRTNPNLGERFVAERKLGLFTVSNQLGNLETWFSLKAAMCKFRDDNGDPNIARSVLSSEMKALETTLTKDGKEDWLTGGTWLGCWSWKECKEATELRCANYGMIASLGVACGLLLVGAAASAGMGVFCYGSEKSAKKQVVAAEYDTFYCGLIAFLCCFFAVSAWVGITKSYFREMKTKQYYPYPFVHYGSLAAGGTCFLLFNVAVCGYYRNSDVAVQDYDETYSKRDRDDDPSGGEERGKTEVHHHYHSTAAHQAAPANEPPSDGFPPPPDENAGFAPPPPDAGFTPPPPGGIPPP